jgi:tRNA A37 threonylcarbamoyladenosine modification protein TsaB
LSRKIGFVTLKTLTLIIPLYMVSFLAVLVENGGHVGAAALVAVAVSASKFLVMYLHRLYWR